MSTIGALVAAAAARTPSNHAVADASGSELTWSQFDRAGNQAAHALVKLGLAHGDRVVAVVDENLDMLALHLGAARAAVALVPVSRRLSADEIAIIIADSTPAVIIYDAPFAGLVHRAVTHVDLQPTPVLVEIGSAAAAPQQRWEALLADAADEPIDLARADDVFYIGYTSGTTGQPKAIVATHEQCRQGAAAASITYGLPSYGSTIMTASLCFLAAAVAHFWSHVYVNSSVELMGTFDVDHLVRRIEARAATFVFLPAPMVEPVLRRFQAGAGYRSLTTILLGGSGTPVTLAHEFGDLAGDAVVNGYGLSETLGPITLSRASQWATHQDGGVLSVLGRAAPPAVVTAVDADGVPVPHDSETVGEAVVRTPALMREYRNNPTATATAIDADGWFRTGDLVTISPDGVVVYRGRLKDMIVTGGLNVYAADVETVLNDHPAVRECAVVGAPHPKWVESVVAFVAVNESPDPAGVLEAELIDHCRQRLAHYKCPTRVILLPGLPHNANGKIAKPELREQLV